jgi:hypothetical protein
MLEHRHGIVGLCPRCQQPVVEAKFVAGRPLLLDAEAAPDGALVMTTTRDCELYRAAWHEGWTRYRMHRCRGGAL